MFSYHVTTLLYILLNEDVKLMTIEPMHKLIQKVSCFTPKFHNVEVNWNELDCAFVFTRIPD